MIPPTLYAIPRVQAEIKIGFSQVSDHGFNIILLKNESQDKSFGESTINFDVVAVPPPPGPPDRFTQPIPEISGGGRAAQSTVAGERITGFAPPGSNRAAAAQNQARPSKIRNSRRRLRPRSCR